MRVKSAEQILAEIALTARPPTDWEVFLSCGTCDAEKGKHCVSQKNGAQKAELRNPHPGRKLVPRYSRTTRREPWHLSGPDTI